MRTRSRWESSSASLRTRRRPVGLALVLALAAGCGHDPEVIAKQDEEIRRVYERQKGEPKWLTPEQNQIRRERLELEYGGVPPK